MSTKVADLLRKAVQAAAKAGPITPPQESETADELAHFEQEAIRPNTGDRAIRPSPSDR